MLTWDEVNIIVRDLVSEPNGWRVIQAQRKRRWTVTVWRHATKQGAEIRSWDGWQQFQWICLQAEATV